MNSTIKEIYYVMRGRYDTHKDNEEYFKLLKNFNNLSQELLNCKPAERKQILDKMDEVYSGLESQVASGQFINGFKLGLLIGIEAAGSDAQI